MIKYIYPKICTFLFFFLSLLDECILFSLNDNLNIPILRFTLNGNNLGDAERIIIKKILPDQPTPTQGINISENIEFLGKLDLILDNIYIKITNSTDIELLSSFIEEKNINFILNIINGEIVFNYRFQSGLLSGTGNGTLYFNLTLSLNNTIIRVQNNHEPEKIMLGLHLDSVSLNDLDSRFSFSKNGTFEKLIKYFNKNLLNIFIDLAVYEFESRNIIQTINDYLYFIFSNINMNIPINNLLQIDDNVNVSFSLNEEYIIKNNLLEIPLEAELIGDHYKYDKDNTIFLPHLINNSYLLTEKTINGVVSQFIFNNFLDVLYFFGKFNIIITNDTLGISELTVGVISVIIPEIVPIYKSGQKVKIITNALESPVLKIYENNILKLYLKENLKFFVFNETNYLYEDIGTIAIDADSEIEIVANYIVNDTDIQFKISDIILSTFDVKNSTIGEIDTERVKNNFKSLLSLILSQINGKIKDIIQDLPKPFNIQGIGLNELCVQSYEDYLKFDLSPILSSLVKLLI